VICRSAANYGTIVRCALSGHNDQLIAPGVFQETFLDRDLRSSVLDSIADETSDQHANECSNGWDAVHDCEEHESWEKWQTLTRRTMGAIDELVSDATGDANDNRHDQR